MTSMSSTLDADRANGPRRWGLAFAGIWLFYLLSPLSAAWQQRDSWHGWVGIGATLLFAAVYLTIFVSMRWRRTGAPFGAPLGRPLGFGLVGLEIALGVLMCVAIGQEGTAAAVYIAVTCVMCLADEVGMAGRRHRRVGHVRRHDRRPGLAQGPRHPVRHPGGDAGDLGHLAGDQPQHRGAGGARGERQTGPGRRAQPVRPRPARHPRPLAHGDHGEGGAGEPPARRRPRAGSRRARATWSGCRATRSPTYAEPSTVTATSRCPASWRGRGPPCQRPRSLPTFLTPPTTCPPTAGSCSRGRSARASPT